MILLLTETLTAGGAEIFVLRLAKQLKQNGFECIVFNCHKRLVNERLMSEFDDVHIVHFNSFFDGFLLKLDRLFQRMKLDVSLRHYFVAKQVKDIIKKFNVRVLHSHLFKVDYTVALINRGLNLKHVITNHGDYHLYHSFLKNGDSRDVIHFHKKAAYVFQHASSIVCISHRQIEEIGFYGEELKKKAKIIYNGLTIKNTAPGKKSELGIPENAFVFGMVARGIREKGWEYALSAFNKLNTSAAHFILVGDGEYLRAQKEEIDKNSNIHWVGFSHNPQEWISLFNVGLLPSFYKAESQPNVILEYLALGKPVISSDSGDVSLMLNVCNANQCGYVTKINAKAPYIDVSELKSLMQSYIDDKALLEAHSRSAKERFKDFNMDTCARKYEAEYFAAK